MPKFFRNRFTLGSIPQLDSIPGSPIPMSGLNLWLDASNITGLSDGNTITNWLDKSGNNNTASQSNSSYRPIYKTNILNGKPIVRFDGSNDFLEIANAVFSGLSSNVSVFMVTMGSVYKYQFTFCAYSDDGNNRFSAHLPYSGTGMFWDYGDLANGGRVNGEWGGSLGSYYAWTLLAGGSNMTVRRNKTQVLSSSASSSFNPSGKTFRVGGDSSLGTFAGDYAELLIYNRRLSSDEITQVENYLMSKYNLS